MFCGKGNRLVPCLSSCADTNPSTQLSPGSFCLEAQQPGIPMLCLDGTVVIPSQVMCVLFFATALIEQIECPLLGHVRRPLRVHFRSLPHQSTRNRKLRSLQLQQGVWRRGKSI